MKLVAQPTAGVADILIVVDNSASMAFEAEQVHASLNAFSSEIGGSEANVRVVLVSSYPDIGNGLCIDPPLGELGEQGEGCAEHHDDDPAALSFTHIDEYVDNHDPWERLLATHDQWSAVTRPEVTKHVVVITDGASNLDWSQFRDAFLTLDPSHADFIQHSVVCHSQCESAHGVGDDYITLTQETGGIAADLCEQDLQPVFDALVLDSTGAPSLACEIELPPAPEGQQHDFDEITVELETPTGDQLSLDPVRSASACDEVADGWYYDDPIEPTSISICPQTCDAMQGSPDVSVRIDFVCEPDSRD